MSEAEDGWSTLPQAVSSSHDGPASTGSSSARLLLGVGHCRAGSRSLVAPSAGRVWGPRVWVGARPSRWPLSGQRAGTSWMHRSRSSPSRESVPPSVAPPAYAILDGDASSGRSWNPVRGQLTYDFATFQLDEDRRLTLTVYTPSA